MKRLVGTDALGFSALTVFSRGRPPLLRLSPFLLFGGECAEAMEFYHSCFGGSLTLTRVSDTPMKAQFPPEQHHKITYALLTSGVVEFSATDWLHPVHQRQQGNTTAMYVLGDSFDELSSIFSKLRKVQIRSFLLNCSTCPLACTDASQTATELSDSFAELRKSL